MKLEGIVFTVSNGLEDDGSELVEVAYWLRDRGYKVLLPSKVLPYPNPNHICVIADTDNTYRRNIREGFDSAMKQAGVVLDLIESKAF